MRMTKFLMTAALATSLFLAPNAVNSKSPAKRAPARAAKAVAPAPKPIYAKPALWKLEDEDTKIYLFGTIHVLPKNMVWHHGLVKAATDDSQELVLETVDDQMVSPEANAFMKEVFSAKVNPTPLLARVSPENQNALKNVMAKVGMRPTGLDAMPTWLVSFMIEYSIAAKRGETGIYGADNVLERHFKASKRPVSAVEDGLTIMKSMHAIPEDDQRKSLDVFLKDFEKNEKEGPVLTSHWGKGNLDRLADDLTEESFGKLAYDILIQKRNTAWTGWLKNRMTKPGRVFFAVGGGHFVGKDSVLLKLEAEGIKVTRVQ